jgi:hypothetical protein
MAQIRILNSYPKGQITFSPALAKLPASLRGAQ